MRFRPFTSKGAALGWEFPPDCGSPSEGGVYGETVSQLLVYTSM